MRKAQVEIGGTYYANVSGKRVKVTVTSESPYGGWNGRNNVTGRDVRIRSAQRLTAIPAERIAHPSGE
jgi:hypothetical protein